MCTKVPYWIVVEPTTCVKVGHKNPSIWKLLKNMKNEVGADNAKLTLSEIGQLTYKRLHKGHIMQTRLKNLCEQFTRGELSVDIFLTNIRHNIRMKSD